MYKEFRRMVKRNNVPIGYVIELQIICTKSHETFEIHEQLNENLIAILICLGCF